MNVPRRYWLLAIPMIWLGILLTMMEPGAVVQRADVATEFSLLFYDPSDIGAFVLRGANFSMGRAAGRLQEAEWEKPEELEKRLDAPPEPLQDKYYLEYPSTTLVLFRLGFLSKCEMPAAVADYHQFSLSHFRPRNDAERVLWAKFHHAAVVHVILMTAALIGLILVLQQGYESGQPKGAVWLAVLPGAVFFSLNRFDIVPALATALGFFCLGRGRRGWSGAWFALGVLLKIYPVLFVPIILRHLGPIRGARWLAGFAATILFGISLSTILLGWEPTVQPILLQMSRPYEETRTLYGRVLPEALAHSSALRLAILGAIGFALIVSRPADLSGVLRRCSIILTVFLALAVFWSPQWVVWYLPLVVPLAARHRWLAGVAAALDLLNYFQFPVIFWVLWGNFPDMLMRVTIEICIGTRIACWTALAGGLAWLEFRSPKRQQPIGNPSQ